MSSLISVSKLSEILLSCRELRQLFIGLDLFNLDGDEVKKQKKESFELFKMKLFHNFLKHLQIISMSYHIEIIINLLMTY